MLFYLEGINFAHGKGLFCLLGYHLNFSLQCSGVAIITLCRRGARYLVLIGSGTYKNVQDYFDFLEFNFYNSDTLREN